MTQTGVCVSEERLKIAGRLLFPRCSEASTVFRGRFGPAPLCWSQEPRHCAVPLLQLRSRSRLMFDRRWSVAGAAAHLQPTAGE
jgi:hypothetical protein